MKILHVVPSYIPAYGYGGPIESVHALNEALTAAGEDVTVFTTDRNGSETLRVPLGQEVLIDGVGVWYFPVSFPRDWFYSAAMHRALKERVKDFDIIHITSVWLAPGALGAHYAKKFKKPYIISPRGSLMRDPLRRKSWKKKMYFWFFEKRNLKNAAAVHFTTERESRDYFGRFPFQESFVVPNIILPAPKTDAEFSLRKKLNIDSKKKIVLSLGRLHHIKGFDTLVSAFAEVANKMPDSVLVIAGNDEGGYRKEIEKMVYSFSLGERVFFVGMLGKEQKENAFRESNVFVMPSYSENFGMASGEAMRAGLPVVVTDVVGISDIVIATESGVVIRKDTKECASAILKILSDPGIAVRFGYNGRRAASKYFAPQRVAEQMIREYNKVVKI